MVIMGDAKSYFYVGHYLSKTASAFVCHLANVRQAVRKKAKVKGCRLYAT